MLSKPRVRGLCSDPTASDGKGEVLTLRECQWPKRPEWRLSLSLIVPSVWESCLGPLPTQEDCVVPTSQVPSWGPSTSHCSCCHGNRKH